MEPISASFWADARFEMVTINELGEFTTYDGAERMFAYVDDPRSLECHGNGTAARGVVRSDGKHYPSTAAAGMEIARERGITPKTAVSSIGRVLSPNNRKTKAYGYGWSYE